MARPRQGARASAPVVKNDANAPALTIWAQFFILPKLYGIIVLAAFSRQLSTLCLSPVYGSLLASFELGWKLLIPLIWLAKMALSESQLALTNWFPMLGYTHSAIQAYLVMFSGRLGPVHGPHYTYFLTSLPLSYLSLLHVLNVSSGLFSATSNSKLIAGRLWTKLICRGFLLLVLTGIIYIIEAWHAAIINNILFHEIHRMAAAATIRSGRDLLGIKSLATAASSRCGWQALTTLVYTCLERSRLRSIAVLPLLHFALMNPHVPSSYNTAILNKRLKNEGFSLVARQESSTGYISVLDNLREGYRVMRCDHSLLGGEWTNKPEGHPAKLNEPIYSIFLMLEAVRLVGVPSDGLLTVKDALVMCVSVP